jgi:4-carboxymuconolactone decarboxylase
MRVVQPLEVAHFISQKGYSPAMRITPATLDDSLPIHNNIVRVAYNNPDMFRGFGSLSGRVHSASHLSDRVRELVVLSVTGRLHATYEWQAHVPLARKQGISDSEIDALWAGNVAHFQGIDGATVAFARAVDEATVDEQVWQKAREYYSEVDLLDMTILAGFYGLASRLALTFDIEPDLPG